MLRSQPAAASPASTAAAPLHDDGRGDGVGFEGVRAALKPTPKPIEIEVLPAPDPAAHTVFLLTVQMGLEEPVRDEFASALAAAVEAAAPDSPMAECSAAFAQPGPWPVHGFVAVFVPAAASAAALAELKLAVLLRMRSINDVLHYHLHMRLPEREDPKEVPVAVYEDLKARCTANNGKFPEALILECPVCREGRCWGWRARWG